MPFSATICPKLPLPDHGTYAPPTCITGDLFAGDQCVLHCAPGYKPEGGRTIVCDNDLNWGPTPTLNCLPDPSANEVKSRFAQEEKPAVTEQQQQHHRHRHGHGETHHREGHQHQHQQHHHQQTGETEQERQHRQQVTQQRQQVPGADSRATLDRLHPQTSDAHRRIAIDPPPRQHQELEGQTAQETSRHVYPVISGAQRADLGIQVHETARRVNPSFHPAPYIKCPQDTTIILPKGKKQIHIKLQQPKTNVDWQKYVGLVFSVQKYEIHVSFFEFSAM